MWEKLALTIGSSDLIKDPRFLTNSDRLNNQDDLDKPISKFIKKYSREEVLKIFSKEGITVGPVLDISEIIEHPYIQDREILIDCIDADKETYLLSFVLYIPLGAATLLLFPILAGTLPEIL